MRKHFPVVLSATAVLIALLGATPLGHAASSAVETVKTALYAKKAGYAKNAGAVAGIRASRTPKPNKLVPLGADGKFPASVGAIGATGPPGRNRPQGCGRRQGCDRLEGPK